MSRILRATTPFPNHLLDEAMPLLKDTEWRVLCVIVRQTLGWQDKQRQGRKERDWLTRAQLKARTGRNTEALALGIDALIRQGFITAVNDQGQLLLTPADRRRNQGRIYYGLSDAWRALGIERREQSPEHVVTRDVVMKNASAQSLEGNAAFRKIAVSACSVFGNKAQKSEFTEGEEPNTTKENGTKEKQTKERRTQASLITSAISEKEEAGKPIQPVPIMTLTPAMKAFIEQFVSISQEHNIQKADTGLTSRNWDRLQKLIGKNNVSDWTPHLHRFFKSELEYARRGQYSLAAFLDTCYILLVTRAGTSFR
jgi:hypothetical protein